MRRRRWCVREFLCVVMLEFVFHIVGSFYVILGQVILEFGPILHACYFVEELDQCYRGCGRQGWRFDVESGMAQLSTAPH